MYNVMMILENFSSTRTSNLDETCCNQRSYAQVVRPEVILQTAATCTLYHVQISRSCTLSIPLNLIVIDSGVSFQGFSKFFSTHVQCS